MGTNALNGSIQLWAMLGATLNPKGAYLNIKSIERQKENLTFQQSINRNQGDLYKT